MPGIDIPYGAGCLLLLGHEMIMVKSKYYLNYNFPEYSYIIHIYIKNFITFLLFRVNCIWKL